MQCGTHGARSAWSEERWRLIRGRDTRGGDGGLWTRILSRDRWATTLQAGPP